MGDSLRYKDWFEKAAHDLRGAEILMEHDGGNDLVAFHCRQAMEKMLKGWLLKTLIYLRPKRKHGIAWMLQGN